jgi:hypothetical protein
MWVIHVIFCFVFLIADVINDTNKYGSYKCKNCGIEFWNVDLNPVCYF